MLKFQFWSFPFGYGRELNGILNSNIYPSSTVVGPVVAGSIAFVFDYVAVMYFAIAIIVCAFLVSLKVKK